MVIVKIRRCDVCDNEISPSGTFYRCSEEASNDNEGQRKYSFSEEFDSIECLNKAITEILLWTTGLSTSNCLRLEKIVPNTSSINPDSLFDN